MLLSLPPELRNEIYRYALYSQEWLIADMKPEEPGLLRTCYQIRDEASPIHHFGNHFHITVNNYNGEVTHLLRDKWWGLGRGKTPLRICVEMRIYQQPPNWNNLMRWLKLYHRMDVLGLDSHGPAWATTDEMLIRGWFLMAKKGRHLPWRMVREMIECQRKVLGHWDERWLQD